MSSLRKKLNTFVIKRLALRSLFAFLIFMPVQHFLMVGGSGWPNPDVSTAAITSTTSTCSGDFDGDGEVNFADFLAFTSVFGKSSSDAGFDARMDFDGNGEVNFADFLALTSVFGRICPPSPSQTTDRDALVALYNATDGPNWKNNTNWLTDKDLSTWFGVQVSNGRVTYLNLSGNGLSGSIPSELGNLSNLTYLDLSGNGLSGAIPSALGNLRLEIFRHSGNQITYVSPDIITSPPPTWKFSGGIQEGDQTLLREEMEYSRAYFSDRFGIEATGFTVLVGAGYEALSPAYRDVVGRDLSADYHPQAKYTYAWVTSSATGGAVMTLMYGTLRSDPFSSLKHHIAHEYFHVLQGQLGSGFAQLQDGEVGWHSDASSRGPNWLVEGLSSYADKAYTLSRVGRRAFFSRYTPYKDLTWFHLQESVRIVDLVRIEDYRTFKCTFADLYSYGLSFAASDFLVGQAEEDSFVNYWKLLGERPTWRQAFEEAFGIDVSDFYVAFDEWLPSQLLPLVQLKLQMRWPDMENQPQTWRFLYLDIENWGSWENNTRSSHQSTGWTGLRGLPLYMTFTYDEGAVGTGYLSLWWSDDQCTEYLLGWYKDGELASRREDATAVDFTGRSSIIAWTIPGHPDTLPRLEERKRVAGCQ